MFTARQRADCAAPDSSRRFAGGEPWSDATGASKQRDKGTETEPGTASLSLRSCPRGHRVACGLDARIPARLSAKEGARHPTPP
ncbi:MAG TPA: hypothetical protein PKE37_09480, partial [Thiomonas arsenitoxydans]|uniref:hypothetical protein n=1 Tax=Thiomonas arsenitoxydans (strain DSM 22701 / CIP 110005 / 3As) TaxID=426114 RepID=UPI002CFE9D7D